MTGAGAGVRRAVVILTTSYPRAGDGSEAGRVGFHKV